MACPLSPPPCRLLVVSPIEPRLTGNGLAMRVASLVEAASASVEVQVAVVPVAGGLPACRSSRPWVVHQVAWPGAGELARATMALAADRRWRALLASAGDLPPMARGAPAGLAPALVAACGVPHGAAVLAVRSYMAPLGLAVADRLGSPWAAVDLDDDDEALAAPVDPALGAAFGRLVGTFAPLYSACSLASFDDARAVGRRHGIETRVVANTVAVPPGPLAPRPGTGTVLFVGNLTYQPNLLAARALVDEVLPILAAGRGAPVRVELVGPVAPADLGRLAARPEVTVRGYVEDLAAVYRRADVVVAPLTRGSGTRIKLLEAFAQGVPVVTTPVGAAGLAVRSGDHLLVGSTPAALAAGAAAVLDDPALSARLVRAARSFVAAHHAPVHGAAHVRALLAAAARRGAWR